MLQYQQYVYQISEKEVTQLVYFCKDLPEHISAEQISLIPYERRIRLEKYRRESDRILCAAAYQLYLYGMKAEYGFVPQQYWKTDENGKPYLEGYKNVAFNISHCAEGVACVFGNGCCGIDYQDLSEIKTDISKMVCGAGELQALSESSRPEKLLCRIWALKEAYGKYHGSGITYGMKDYDFSGTPEAAFERYGLCFSVKETETSCIAVCADRFYEPDEFKFVEYDLL